MPRLSGHIKLIAVGRLRQPHWVGAQDDYRSRLARYTEFTLVEVKDAVGQGYPDAVALKREGEMLLKAAESASRKIALTQIGVQRSSPQLAAYINRQVQIYGRLAFIMGGSLGFPRKCWLRVTTRFHCPLSPFPMKWPASSFWNSYIVLVRLLAARSITSSTRRPGA
jgi:23S rRNA (pseudouridine1915-N3)-methyltransferase